MGGLESIERAPSAKFCMYIVMGWWICYTVAFSGLGKMTWKG